MRVLEGELETSRGALAEARAAGERSAAEARMASSLNAGAVITSSSDGGRRGGVGTDDAQISSSVAAIASDKADAAADETQLTADEVDVAADEANVAATELYELRMELVEAKIAMAQLAYEKEQYRGKLSRATKQLDRLGGDSLAVAQLSTKMEVRLAQALQEAAQLREENGALQEDVKGMIELKLKMAELTAE